MINHKLPSLLAGLALGATASWTLRHVSASPPASSASPASALLVSGSSHPGSSGAPGSLLLPLRLAGPDADAALDAYLALPPLIDPNAHAEFAERSARLRALLTLLPDSSFDRLLTALATRAGPVEARLRDLAFEVWTERDVPAAARWAAAIVPDEVIGFPVRHSYASRAARAWARTGFDAPYAWASALADPTLKRTVSAELLGGLAATDPARALELARAGDDPFFTTVRREVFRVWSEKHPAAALQSLGAALLSDGPSHHHVTGALSKWAVADPSTAFAWLDTQSGLEPAALDSTVWTLVNRISNNPTKSDLRPFADALAARFPPGEGQGRLSDLLRAWAGRDSSAALAWLDSIPDAARRTDLLTQAIDNGSPEQPEKNLPLALHLPPGPERDTALANTLTRWAGRDPDAALAWLREHDDPSFATVAARVQGRLLGDLAATDPAAALARWQSLPADESRIAAAPGIANAWAATDPAAAARWISAQLPELPAMGPDDFDKMSPQDQAELERKFMAYEGHFDALSKTAKVWSQKDPAGLIAWAENLSSPLLKEGLLGTIVENYGGRDEDLPDRAVLADRISTITDPALRDRILGKHLQTWLGADLQAAREWIESHDALSPEKAAELLTRVAQPTP